MLATASRKRDFYHIAGKRPKLSDSTDNRLAVTKVVGDATEGVGVVIPASTRMPNGPRPSRKDYDLLWKRSPPNSKKILSALAPVFHKSKILS